MNVVIYTQDMEPITIIDLPLAAIQFGLKRQFLMLPVPIPFQMIQDGGARIDDLVIRTVALEFNELRMPNGQTSWIVVTQDEEVALMLRPAWLPGQRGAINDYEGVIRRLRDALLLAVVRGMGR